MSWQAANGRVAPPPACSGSAIGTKSRFEHATITSHQGILSKSTEGARQAPFVWGLIGRPHVFLDPGFCRERLVERSRGRGLEVDLVKRVHKDLNITSVAALP